MEETLVSGSCSRWHNLRLFVVPLHSALASWSMLTRRRFLPQHIFAQYQSEDDSWEARLEFRGAEVSLAGRESSKWMPSNSTDSRKMGSGLGCPIDWHLQPSLALHQEGDIDNPRQHLRVADLGQAVFGRVPPSQEPLGPASPATALVPRRASGPTWLWAPRPWEMGIPPDPVLMNLQIHFVVKAVIRFSSDLGMGMAPANRLWTWE